MESELCTGKGNANDACLLLIVFKWNVFHKHSEKKV